MDWLTSGQTTKERIMQGFGVNPIIAGQVEGANRASSLAAEDHFCRFTINPKIELLSQCLTEWLGPMFGNVDVWIEPCVPDDTEMQIKKLTLAAQHGALKASELREFCGLPPDPAFADALVGGRNMQTTNPIEAGIRGIIHQALAENDAAAILAEADAFVAGRNGRAH
jgi:hypothetical protein